LATPEANLVRGMQWFQNTYARCFNQRHRPWGRVFGSRYKVVVVSDDRICPAAITKVQKNNTRKLSRSSGGQRPGPFVDSGEICWLWLVKVMPV
jgi:hypothetical protein